jgi:purine-binding chemotaxis protein CheW
MTSYCVFNVGERRIGINLSSVREIVEHQLIHPTPIPLTPPFVHGLFNLRGQVLPYLDLSAFVGAGKESRVVGRDDRTVIVERGNLRFATLGQRIDTVEADPALFQPLASAALYPALEAEAQTDRGNFEVIHLDRLEACLGQALKFTETGESGVHSPQSH